MSTAVKSYSLWVMPKGSLANKLHAEIKWLASQTPGAPVFLPHVTLLGGIHATEDDVLARAAALAKQLKPYRITFDRAASGTIFHQCVYLLCQRDPDTLHAGAATRAAYGHDPGSPYMPHLSLLYSDISDEERSGGAEAPYAAGSLLGIRRRALSGNPSLLLACLTEGPAYICCRMSTAADEQQRLFEGHSPLLGQDLGFDVSSLTVWETEESDKTLLSWIQLAEYPLEGQ